MGEVLYHAPRLPTPFRDDFQFCPKRFGPPPVALNRFAPASVATALQMEALQY